jgi:hypothetical protein
VSQPWRAKTNAFSSSKHLFRASISGSRGGEASLPQMPVSHGDSIYRRSRFRIRVLDPAVHKMRQYPPPGNQRNQHWQVAQSWRRLFRNKKWLDEHTVEGAGPTYADTVPSSRGDASHSAAEADSSVGRYAATDSGRSFPCRWSLPVQLSASEQY